MPGMKCGSKTVLATNYQWKNTDEQDMDPVPRVLIDNREERCIQDYEACIIMKNFSKLSNSQEQSLGLIIPGVQLLGS